MINLLLYMSVLCVVFVYLLKVRYAFLREKNGRISIHEFIPKSYTCKPLDVDEFDISDIIEEL